jgi:PAS domain S-box-containing protein
MAFYICPNCKQRAIDEDGRDGLTHQPVGCTRCGFGFLFEVLEDYYPRPGTGMVVCDAERRIIAVGRGVFELTGHHEAELLGQDVTEALAFNGFAEDDPAAISLEWGVRQLGRELTVVTSSGGYREVVVDYFPAYDDDGGLLVAFAPR